LCIAIFVWSIIVSPDLPKPSPTDVTEIVVNLDDVTGELIGEAQRTLLRAGALDVWTTAIQMKKQRPGVMLSLLCESGKRDELARLVIELTGSFGVRFRDWGRLVLDRRHITVDTRFGKLRIKVGELDGKVVVARPEFDDAKRLAQEAGATVREVLDAAQAAAEAVPGLPGGRGVQG
jgi:pyridinium-3,5-bisthiocarboxylic acid mononucleotide nickel chelatase